MRAPRVNQPTIVIIAIIIALFLIAFISILTIEPAVDDAYIVYRYVDRFLEHKGLTYNDGEYVEGFTSLLWTLLLVGGSFIFDSNPHIVSVWINYVFIILCALSIYWLLKILQVRKFLSTISLVLFGISILYFKVVFLGLEFGLFALLLILYFCFSLRSIGYPDYRSINKFDSFLSGILGVALFATRPEAIIVFPTSLFITFLFHRHNQNVKISLVHSGFIFTILLAVVIGWRLIYFGEILPNSVIAKSIPLSSLFAKVAPISRKSLIKDSTAYLVDAYTLNPGLLFSFLLVSITILKRWRPYEQILLISPIFWQHVIIILNGGDWMAYSRFITMFVPLYIVILLLLVDIILNQSVASAFLSLAIFVCLHSIANIPYLTFSRPFFERSSTFEIDSFGNVGLALNEVWLDGDILIPEATGQIAYFMPNAFVRDPAGLTDKTLAKDQNARRSIFGRQNWYYSLSLKPSLIVLQFWPHQRNWTTFDLGYPENFVFYCLPPLPEVNQKQWLYIVMRHDKKSIYGPPLVSLGAIQLAYEDFEDLEQYHYRNCHKPD